MKTNKKYLKIFGIIFFSILFANLVSAQCDPGSQCTINTFMNFVDEPASNTLTVTKGDLVPISLVAYSHGDHLIQETLVIGSTLLFEEHQAGFETQPGTYLYQRVYNLNTIFFNAGTYGLMFIAENSVEAEASTLTLIIQDAVVPDTTAPVVDITYPQSTIYSSHVTQMIFNVVEENLDTCQYNLNSAGWVNFPSATNGQNILTGITSQEGSNTWQVRCTDEAGNTGSDSVTFTVTLETQDTTDPVVEITYPQNTTYTSHVTELRFTVVEENLDTCQYNLGFGWTNYPSASSGTNTITGITSVEGSNTWQVRCTDEAGNTGSDSVTFTVTLETQDTTDPVVEITYPQNTTYTSHVTELRFTLIEENLDSCEYKLNDQEWNDFFGAANGENTITGITSQEGSNTWQVRCQDLELNFDSDSVTFTVTLETQDTTDPVVEITYPQNTTYTSHVTELRFTVVEENLDTCQYNLGFGWTNYPSASTGTNTVTGITSQEGSNTWQVRCTDEAGNTGSDSVTFTVDLEADDTTAPVVEITFPQPIVYIEHVNQLDFNVIEENLDFCEYKLNSAPWTVFSSATEGLNAIGGITSQEGSNTWQVRCTDEAGNTGSDSVTFTVTLETQDTTDPVVEITYPLNTTYSSQITQMIFNVVEENLDTCQYNLGFGWTNYPSASTGTNTVTGITSQEGSNTWQVRCFDESDNEGSDSVTFTVDLGANDTTAPVVEINFPEDGETYEEQVTQLNFTSIDENLDYCVYTINGNTPVIILNPNNGVNVITGVSSSEGSNTWSVTCYDDSDNSDIDTVTFTVDSNGEDTTAPVVNIIYPVNTTYSSHVTQLRFNVVEENLSLCHYNLNSQGWITILSGLTGLNTVSGITSVEGSNTWQVRCTDTSNNQDIDSVTFTVDLDDDNGNGDGDGGDCGCTGVNEAESSDKYLPETNVSRIHEEEPTKIIELNFNQKTSFWQRLVNWLNDLFN